MINILVTGGAGFIGSHMVDMLVRVGYRVIVLDNLSTGFKDAVLDAELIVADLADRITLDALFAKYKFSAVLHFAGSIQVAESVQNPAKYYQNNIANGLNLLDAMVKYDVKNLVFSSSAAVYGEPEYSPIDVGHPKNPLNPYGRSKWVFEQILEDYDNAYGLKSISLRYFNAAGSDPDARLGERHVPETHLIPLVLDVALGKRENIVVFGNDYPTCDGSCIRDYVHVTDLCEAHLLALKKLFNGEPSEGHNLGNGQGYSVLEIIDVAKKITGKNIPIVFSARRSGDPAILVADATRSHEKLHWQPKYPDLETIVKHAWGWRTNTRFSQ